MCVTIPSFPGKGVAIFFLWIIICQLYLGNLQKFKRNGNWFRQLRKRQYYRCQMIREEFFIEFIPVYMRDLVHLLW